MHILINRISASRKVFGFKFSLDKTIVLLQPPPDNPYFEPAILAEGNILRVLDHFLYVSCVLGLSCSLNDEVYFRL